METKVLAVGALGAGIGALQTPLIREYVDKKYPTWSIESLKGFGKPAALIGMGAGGASLLIGAVGAMKGKDGRQRLGDMPVAAAIDYGITAFVGGVMSGLYPVAETITTSMYRPGVQAAYQSPGIDMNVLKQMSAEVQRLNQENAALRVQTQVPAIMVEPGQVTSKQRRYGFMDGVETAQPLVGRRTEQLRKKFDFMG